MDTWNIPALYTSCAAPFQTKHKVIPNIDSAVMHLYSFLTPLSSSSPLIIEDGNEQIFEKIRPRYKSCCSLIDVLEVDVWVVGLFR